MPHVDDGTLHALLDGALPAADPARAEAVEAHLEGCADCRARLEAAAGLRERAGSILAALAPEARPGAAPPLTPDFDDVRRRAAARGGAGEAPSAGAPRRGLRWGPVLAWAASLVIALGIGYLIRDQVVPAAGRPEAALRTAAPSAGSEEMAGEGADAAALPEAEVGGEEADAGAIRSTASDAAASGAGGETPRPEPGTGGAGAAGEERARVAREALQEQDLASAAPQPAAPLHAAEPPSPRRQTAQAPEAAEEAIRGGAEPAAVEDTVFEIAESEPVEVTAAKAAPEGWRRGTAAEARRLLGGPLYALPGARVVDVLLADATPETPRVRTRQRLPDGDLLEVSQRPLASERFAEELVVVPRRRLGRRDPPPQAQAMPAPPPPVADESAADPAHATPSATVVLDGFELTVAGDLPPAALRTLARNAVPLGAAADDGP